jgi:hypothetical protein
MKQEIEILQAAMQNAILGEDIATFKNPAFQDVVRASGLVAECPYACEVLGRSGIAVLLAHMSASMHAEREIAVMRNGGRS